MDSRNNQGPLSVSRALALHIPNYFLVGSTTLFGSVFSFWLLRQGKESFVVCSSVFAPFVSVFGLIWSSIGDGVHHRKMLLAGVLLSACAPVFLCLAAQSDEYTIPFALLVGLVNAAANTVYGFSWEVTSRQMVAPKYYARFMRWGGMAGSLVAVGVPLIAAWLLDQELITSWLLVLTFIGAYLAVAVKNLRIPDFGRGRTPGIGGFGPLNTARFIFSSLSEGGRLVRTIPFLRSVMLLRWMMGMVESYYAGVMALSLASVADNQGMAVVASITGLVSILPSIGVTLLPMRHYRAVGCGALVLKGFAPVVFIAEPTIWGALGAHMVGCIAQAGASMPLQVLSSRKMPPAWAGRLGAIAGIPGGIIASGSIALVGLAEFRTVREGMLDRSCLATSLLPCTVAFLLLAFLVPMTYRRLLERPDWNELPEEELQ